MALVMPNQGEAIALEALVNKTAPETLELRLFTNNYTPINSTDETDVTEASGSGYSAKTLTGGSWTVTPGSPSSAAYAQQTFTFSGALGNVYGYYITQATSDKLVWAERFSNGPYNVQNVGDEIKVTPTITLQSNTSD
jgi:hypothetical protein